MYCVLCTVYSVLSVYCILQTVYCILRIWYCKNMHCVPCTVYFELFSVCCVLYAVYCYHTELRAVCCVLCTVYCPVNFAHCVTLYCVLCTVLCVVDCVLWAASRRLQAAAKSKARQQQISKASILSTQRQTPQYLSPTRGGAWIFAVCTHGSANCILCTGHSALTMLHTVC